MDEVQHLGNGVAPGDVGIELRAEDVGCGRERSFERRGADRLPADGRPRDQYGVRQEFLGQRVEAAEVVCGIDRCAPGLGSEVEIGRQRGGDEGKVIDLMAGLLDGDWHQPPGG